MDTDEKITIAKELKEEFTGIDRNEFSKWIGYLTKHDIKRSLDYACYLSMSPMLRTLPKESYKKICTILNKKKYGFEKIEHSELIDIVGYVRWLLIGETVTLRGAFKKAKVTKKDLTEAKLYGSR